MAHINRIVLRAAMAALLIIAAVPATSSPRSWRNVGTMIRRLMIPIAAAMMVACAGAAYPQTFPGSSAGQSPGSAFPPVHGSPGGATVTAPPGSFPPTFGGGGFGAPPAQAGPGADCMSRFAPLAEDIKKHNMALEKVMSGGKKHPVSPDEACKLFGGLARAQSKALKFVEANAARCAMPSQFREQLSMGLKKIESIQKNACTAAQQRPAGPSLSAVLGSASAPEINTDKKGGSTFDTLTGNALSR